MTALLLLSALAWGEPDCPEGLNPCPTVEEETAEVLEATEVVPISEDVEIAPELIREPTFYEPVTDALIWLASRLVYEGHAKELALLLINWIVEAFAVLVGLLSYLRLRGQPAQPEPEVQGPTPAQNLVEEKRLERLVKAVVAKENSASTNLQVAQLEATMERNRQLQEKNDKLTEMWEALMVTAYGAAGRSMREADGSIRPMTDQDSIWKPG